MNPKKETQFDELQLKLGIKSSLPNIKAALALLLSIWESGIHGDGFVYAKEVDDKISPVDAVVDRLSVYFGCKSDTLIALLPNNPLYTSQMEALQVAFELGWRLAKFSFVDESFPFSKERTGGKRYAKKISYTKNIDVVSLFLKQDEDNKKILYAWLTQSAVDGAIAAKEDNLKQLLTALSEECVFRIRTNEDGTYTFRNYGIYDAIVDGGEVSTADAKEQVGPLRILNSIINDGLNYYFVKQPNGTVKLREGVTREEMEQYSTRVQNYLSLSDVHMSFSENTEEDNAPKRMSPEWFSKMAVQYSSMDIESDTLYKDFRTKYGPDALRAVDGNALLHKIFINETHDKENLCYVLEFDKQFAQFGGIGGGSAYKYGLYYSAEKQSWMTGSARNPKALSLAEAISLGTTIRNEILAGVKIIEDAGELTELKDYAELNTKLYEVMPTIINKKWVIKYFHMLFPQLFPPFYNDEWQNKVLTAIDEEPDGNSFIRMGQIALFVKKCGISTLAFSKVIYNLDSLGEIEDEEPVVVDEQFTFDSEIKNGKNIVVYGTPGCGKSFYVQNKLLASFGVVNDEQHRIRTTFYQDYTNTDFVGQIIPKVKEDKSVTYEFNPGPFALALKMAIERPNEPVALIIEELNRGNAASIFGDIFQLLDRTDNGKSQYKITNVNLQDYLNKVFKERNIYFDYIVIPSNLYIVATMNTSDQNVFTLDTAFKRRWKFEKLPNVFAKDHEYAGYYVPGMTGITWRQLVDAINKYIVKNADELSSEDKQLGVYFISKETLCKEQANENDELKKKEFAYKLLEYLWDDVAKYNRVDWFGPDIKTLDQLISEYMEKGQRVFVDGIIG